MKPQKPIDWQSARARLAQNRAATDRALNPDAARIATVYGRRAHQLAQPPAPADDGARQLRVLVFQVGGGMYGIEISGLSEIVPQPACTPLPGGPPQLAGVVQVRGQIRPVWDVSRLLGHRDTVAAGSEPVLICKAGTREIGLRVGTVDAIRTYRTEELREGGVESRAVKWITPDLVSVLDPEKLFEEDVR